MRICSLYGAGFFYIPGTDTCIKLGGYLRADTTFNGGVHGQPAWSGDSASTTAMRDYFISRSRMALTFDTRTSTEYGVVRTFGQADFQFSTFGTATNTYSISSTASPSAGTELRAEPPGGGYVAVEYLFIQFAGFTFGKSASAYATPWQGFPGNITSYLLGGQNTDTGVNNIQYTAQFGNGVSGTIGLDDPTVWDRTAVYNLVSVASPAGPARNAYAGSMPRTSSATSVSTRLGVWSSFQPRRTRSPAPTMNIGAAGAWSAARRCLSEISGHPDTKWGGSVMGALQVKNIPTGAGDDIKMDVSYAKGDTKYVIATAAASPNFAMFGDTGCGLRSVGFGATTDGVYFPAQRRYDGCQLTEPRASAAHSTTIGIRTGRPASTAATRRSAMTAANDNLKEQV